MPTYQYRCENGHEFELFQKMSDAPVDACAECGAAAHRVVSGGGGFLFKGAGFYITDYRSDDYRKKADAEREPSSDAAPAAKSSSGGSDDSGKPASGGEKGKTPGP